jgi:hypothetical protein
MYLNHTSGTFVGNKYTTDAYGPTAGDSFSLIEHDQIVYCIFVRNSIMFMIIFDTINNEFVETVAFLNTIPLIIASNGNRIVFGGYTDTNY